MSVCVWLLSLSVFSRSIHFVAYQHFFLFLAEQYFVEGTYCVLFIHLLQGLHVFSLHSDRPLFLLKSASLPVATTSDCASGSSVGWEILLSSLKAVLAIMPHCPQSQPYLLRIFTSKLFTSKVCFTSHFLPSPLQSAFCHHWYTPEMTLARVVTCPMTAHAQGFLLPSVNIGTATRIPGSPPLASLHHLLVFLLHLPPLPSRLPFACQLLHVFFSLPPLVNLSSLLGAHPKCHHRWSPGEMLSSLVQGTLSVVVPGPPRTGGGRGASWNVVYRFSE